MVKFLQREALSDQAEAGRVRLSFSIRLQKFARALQDLVIPPRCAGCGKIVQDANSLCGECWGDMEWIARPYCSVSGLPFSYDLGEALVSPDVLANPPIYDRARSVTLFGRTARRMVHQLKYRDRTDLATVMGRWMVRAGADCLGDPRAVIVPVPLHRRRLWRRRFNQSALLAKAIAEETGLMFAPDLLQRTRPTRQQVGLSEEERRINVEGAFQVNLSERLSLADRSVVLIDDVWTTGATLEACCRALRRSNAGEICIITFARVAAGSEMPI
ncbi:ComF family protein [uncultured Cohaesibacter sp.]|uniref:ComF family protein n=1 Tax=uncultured Cohaesibacter sp. TaxID=1002546 RepID=UPI0029C89110|nr:ComF family protein [uncultured Cohaesibacter sp.]